MKDRQTDFHDERQDLDQRIGDLSQNRLPLRLILDRVLYPGNVGNIFRTAEAVRASEIILYQCPPFQERVLKKFSRTSNRYIPYHWVQAEEELLQAVPDGDWVILDKTEKSQLIWDFQPSGDGFINLVIGSERYGVAQHFIDRAAISIHLPMKGVNFSINVASATSVACFWLERCLGK